jgi:tryptophan 2,3-dioxygenase
LTRLPAAATLPPGGAAAAGPRGAGDNRMTEPYDPAEEGAEMAFDRRMSYADYLALDRILTAQRPISDAPDEMLFIVQHQTSELWMKLMLHELHAARAAIEAGELPAALKGLARVSRIMEQLNSAWDVLRTMTPSDYTAFRDALGRSSGFQSVQYRLIEFALGNRNPAMLRPHAHDPEATRALEAELARPSLYQSALGHARTLGHAVPAAALEPARRPHVADSGVRALWEAVYRAPGRHWALYEMAEKLVDVEDYFRRWRFNHVTTVERVIGLKRGTGGTGGVSYLRRMLEVELFPELWHVRTEL